MFSTRVRRPDLKDELASAMTRAIRATNTAPMAMPSMGETPRIGRVASGAAALTTFSVGPLMGDLSTADLVGLAATPAPKSTRAAVVNALPPDRPPIWTFWAPPTPGGRGIEKLSCDAR